MQTAFLPQYQHRFPVWGACLCSSSCCVHQKQAENKNAQNGLNYNSILTFTKGWIKINLFPFLYLFLFELLKYANNPTQKVLTVLSRSPSPQMLGSIGWQSRPSAWVQVGQWRRTSQWKVVWERLKKFRSHFSSFQIIFLKLINNSLRKYKGN